MTRAPTNACIDFHCDGAYATATVQVCLNSSADCEGGRLCFFVNNQVQFPERRPGAVTQHPPKVLHAVTALTRGTRKSLFVVDESNGLGEKEVLTATMKQVGEFIGAR